MESTLTVQPKSGVKVRDPDTLLHLPPEGGPVPNTRFWRQRLREGDVTLVSPTQDEVAELEQIEQEE